MATSLFLRSLRRRDLSSASLAAYKAVAENASMPWSPSHMSHKLASLARPFSSKAVAGNDVFGIDFGTTSSCAAVMESKASKMIENYEGSHRTTPSVVAFSQKGELLFASPAKRQAVTNPINTVFGLRLGVEKMGFYPVNRVFSTAAYNQTQAGIKIQQGEQQMASDSKLIGGLDLMGVPRGLYPTNRGHLRPLSPHLSIYKPQDSSTTSIFHRIAFIILTSMIFSYYLVYLNLGSICLTYYDLYKFVFDIDKYFLLSLEITALAFCYYYYKEIRHISKDLSLLRQQSKSKSALQRK